MFWEASYSGVLHWTFLLLQILGLMVFFPDPEHFPRAEGHRPGLSRGEVASNIKAVTFTHSDCKVRRAGPKGKSCLSFQA